MPSGSCGRPPKRSSTPTTRHRPSRHQAGEHPALGGHALVADFGIAKAVSGGTQAHRDRHGGGHAPLHEPGAVAGQRHGWPERPVQPGMRAIRVARGPAAVHGPNPMAVLARHSLEQVPSMQVVRNSIPMLWRTPLSARSRRRRRPLSRHEGVRPCAGRGGSRGSPPPHFIAPGQHTAHPATGPHRSRRTTAKIMRPGGTGTTLAAEFEATL